MLRRSVPVLAKVTGIPWGDARSQLGGTRGNSTSFYTAKKREGFLDRGTLGTHENTLRGALNEYVPTENGKKYTTLPGVEHASDLPADPITRLFFQAKGDHALYQGTFVDPNISDPDRIELQRRDNQSRRKFMVKTPIYDFCHRIREASEQRKRFVIVPATHDTKGAAEVMLKYGLVAGFRDFHNDRAFAVELKYFQAEPVIEVIEPASIDEYREFEWSPKMIRRMTRTHGVHNKIRVFILRTWDGRVIDHWEAAKQNIGGRGLMHCY